MFFRTKFHRAGLWLAALGLLAVGCSKSGFHGAFVPDQRPTVDLTSAPANSTTKYFYAYKIDWSGNDPDGRVDHFMYAIDPPSAAGILAGKDTAWVTTTKNEQIVFFTASQPDSGGGARRTASDFHVFVIKAVDDQGLASVPKSRAFFSYTVAPTVTIVSPAPLSLLQAQVTPSVRISWTGSDPDGQFTQKPVKYKFKLLKDGNSEFSVQKAKQFPDSLRIFYAATNFAGWDSTSAETTQVQFSNLIPNTEYLFVLIGIDEAGAYSPIFSLDSNMLDMGVGFANTLGPIFTVFNQFFFFQYPSGSYAPNDPLAVIPLEVPAGQPITFNWFADPPAGATIEYYRWRVDGDVTDDLPRSDENTDWIHWSQKSPGTVSCTIGPYPALQIHRLYIETKDNNDLKSLAIVQITPVASTFAKPLLIVNDTRLEADRLVGVGTVKTIDKYKKNWPSAAELDTFLFARGNVPWQWTWPHTGSPTVSVQNAGILSTPGLFAGYSFDTIGTRQGFEVASNGVPLSKLGQYKQIVWIIDGLSAQINPGDSGPTAPINPTTTLRWMCDKGKSSTLSSYVFSGGKVWLVGGGGAYGSNFALDATGSKNNNNIYGGQDKTIFSNSSGELIPGRIMYDGAHWQSELTVQSLVNTPIKSSRAIGGWTNPGNGYNGTLTAPDYSLLPAVMRVRSADIGDTVPATRALSQTNQFYPTLPWGFEYLDQPNTIQEDIDPDPNLDNEQNVLDTLMELPNLNSMSTNPLTGTGQIPATMTYYHGVNGPEFVFSGFDLWTFNREDCIQLVDFVLQQIWKLPRAGVDRGATTGSARARGVRPGAAGLPIRATLPTRSPVNTRLPAGRTRE